MQFLFASQISFKVTHTMVIQPQVKASNFYTNLRSPRKTVSKPVQSFPTLNLTQRKPPNTFLRIFSSPSQTFWEISSPEQIAHLLVLTLDARDNDLWRFSQKVTFQAYKLDLELLFHQWRLVNFRNRFLTFPTTEVFTSPNLPHKSLEGNLPYNLEVFCPTNLVCELTLLVVVTSYRSL